MQTQQTVSEKLRQAFSDNITVSRVTGRATLTPLATAVSAAVVVALVAAGVIVGIPLAAEAHAYTAQDTSQQVAPGLTAAEQYADLRTREAKAGDLTLAGGTCEAIAAAVIIPKDWTVECVDHVDTAQPEVVGQASGGSKKILLERLRDPALLRYTATHEAAHAWAESILDEAAKADLIAQVGGGTWAATDLGASYRTSASESFANAFAACRGYGSNTRLLPMSCDVMDAALTAAGTR